MRYSRLFDITPAIGDGLPVYEGDPRPELRRIAEPNGHMPFTSSAWSGSAHTGTHVDAPAHVIPGAATVERLPLEAFVGPARVVASDALALDAAAVRAVAPARGERLLFKTRNGALWERPEFSREFVAFTDDGAEELVRAGVASVGIDYLSVERYGSASSGGSTHLVLFRGGVQVMEGLDLRAVPPGAYFLCFLPMKLVGSDGAPARAVLLAP